MIKKQKPYNRLKEKVKTAKKRKISSTRWLQRQLNDPYVKQSKAEGRRSRAAYKLIQINEKFKERIKHLSGLIGDQAQYNSIISDLIANMKLDEDNEEEENRDEEKIQAKTK